MLFCRRQNEVPFPRVVLLRGIRRLVVLQGVRRSLELKLAAHLGEAVPGFALESLQALHDR